jgi:hypothetical protein
MSGKKYWDFVTIISTIQDYFAPQAVLNIPSFPAHYDYKAQTSELPILEDFSLGTIAASPTVFFFDSHLLNRKKARPPTNTKPNATIAPITPATAFDIPPPLVVWPFTADAVGIGAAVALADA